MPLGVYTRMPVYLVFSSSRKQVCLDRREDCCLDRFKYLKKNRLRLGARGNFNLRVTNAATQTKEGRNARKLLPSIHMHTLLF